LEEHQGHPKKPGAGSSGSAANSQVLYARNGAIIEKESSATHVPTGCYAIAYHPMAAGGRLGKSATHVLTECSAIPTGCYAVAAGSRLG